MNSKMDQPCIDATNADGARDEDWILIRVIYADGALSKLRSQFGVSSLTNYIHFQNMEPQFWGQLPGAQSKGGPFQSIQNDEQGETLLIRMAFLRTGRFDINNNPLVGSIAYIDSGKTLEETVRRLKNAHLEGLQVIYPNHV